MSALTFREIHDGLNQWKQQLRERLGNPLYNVREVHQGFRRLSQQASQQCQIPPQETLTAQEGSEPTMSAEKQSLFSILSPLEPITEPKGPEDITLSHVPWISGTRATCYYGPQAYELDLPTCMDLWSLKGIITVIRKAQYGAWQLGGNYLVGVEICVDTDPDFELPWVGRIAKIKVAGTAAKLESLWGDLE